MPKTRRSKRYHKRGGNVMDSISRTGSSAFNTLGNTADQAGNGISNFFSNGYNKLFKKQSTYPMTGGKYHASTPSNNLATYAAPVAGVKTATPHHWVGPDQKWVGGRRTRRRRKRSSKRK